MSEIVVDIGVACAPSQSNYWWVPVFNRLLEADRHPDIKIGALRGVGSALPDHNKNYIAGDTRGLEQAAASQEEKGRNSLTDSNRNAIMTGFIYGDAEWLYWMDDDTVPPHGIIPHLLSLARPFVSGVYYMPSYPHNPIAYYRQSDGTYAALLDYPMGALVEVDSVGMGCCLIHRSVYEKIMDEHEVLQRPNGSLVPVPKSEIKGDVPSLERSLELGRQSYVKDGVYHQPLCQRHPDDRRPWPFYALEYGRTEDHYFCELAANVGFKPYLDTSIQCEHFKLRAIGRQAHRMAVMEAKSVK